MKSYGQLLRSYQLIEDILPRLSNIKIEESGWITGNIKLCDDANDAINVFYRLALDSIRIRLGFEALMPLQLKDPLCYLISVDWYSVGLIQWLNWGHIWQLWYWKLHPRVSFFTEICLETKTIPGTCFWDLFLIWMVKTFLEKWLAFIMVVC